MSSTNRSLSERSPNDYYITPQPEIVKFLRSWRSVLAARKEEMPYLVLDPCCGGNVTEITIPREKDGQPHPNGPWIFPPSEAAYPEAFKRIPGWSRSTTLWDIREDSRAIAIRNFITLERVDSAPFDAVISNPPFSLALEFIQHALTWVRKGGYVAFLLRSAFFEGKERSGWMRENMPEFKFEHPRRLSFTCDDETDSCAYTHHVWRSGYKPAEARTILLPYHTEEVDQPELLK